MSFDWNGYLDIAKQIEILTSYKSQNNLNEGLQRTAVSRVYYSVYHMALSYAENNFGYKISRDGSNQYHSDIRLEYRKRSNSPKYQEVGRILFSLHKARIDCDYKDDAGNVKSLLSSSIIQAENTRKLLQK